jgi:hypothetical protein
MASREVAMRGNFVVLERAHPGESRSAIAWVTGHSRATVRRIVNPAYSRRPATFRKSVARGRHEVRGGA